MIKYSVFLMVILLAATNSSGFTKTEVPEGWASQSGGTTGGTGGTEIVVKDMSTFQIEAKSSGKKIIIVEKGVYKGRLVVSSDKTILGREPGVQIQGSVIVSGASNVILRNFAIKGDQCNSYDECKGGVDGIGIEKSAHHVWLDHLDISDGQDGNCDITKAADFVTVTWCKFWYSYAKEHRFSNLISSADNVAEDKGKLNITYAYCWWADRVAQRQPRGRSGKVHVINNLYTSTDADYACGPGVEIQMLIEKNVFKNSGDAIQLFDGTPAPAFKSVGNTGTAKNINLNQGTVFTPPYTLSLIMPVSDVETKVKASAGNTLRLDQTDAREKFTETKAFSGASLVQLKNCWALKNQNTSEVTFIIVTISGKTVVPEIHLTAGCTFEIPSTGSPLYIKFTGDSSPRVLYVPVHR